MYREHIEKEGESLHITSESYEAWKNSSITRQLLIDLELELLNCADSISGRTVDEYAIKAVGFESVKQTVDFVHGWKPLALEDQE